MPNRPTKKVSRSRDGLVAAAVEDMYEEKGGEATVKMLAEFYRRAKENHKRRRKEVTVKP